MPHYWYENGKVVALGAAKAPIIITPPPVDPPVDPPPVVNTRDNLVLGAYIPSATTTGPVDPGALEVRSGDITVTRNNAVIENVYMTNGTIRLGSYSGVIIRNVHTRGTTTRGVDTAFIVGANDNLRGALIIDTKLEGQGNTWCSAMRGGNYTAKRVEATNIPDGFALTLAGSSSTGADLGHSTRIEQSWIHNGAYDEWEQEEGQDGTKYYPYAGRTNLAAVTFNGTVQCTAGSRTMTVTGYSFLNRDTNRTVVIQGAGPGGAALTATISTVLSATQVQLAVAATTTVNNGSGTMNQRWWGMYTHVDGVQFHRIRHMYVGGTLIGGVRGRGDHNVYPSQKAQILAGDDMYNAGMLVKQEVDSSIANKIQDVVIEKNFFSGGNTSYNITNGNNNLFDDLFFRDNKFYRSTWGSQMYMLNGPGPYEGGWIGHHTNNTFLDDGSPVPISRGF